MSCHNNSDYDRGYADALAVVAAAADEAKKKFWARLPEIAAQYEAKLEAKIEAARARNPKATISELLKEALKDDAA
jgi:hypothetical protein